MGEKFEEGEKKRRKRGGNRGRRVHQKRKKANSCMPTASRTDPSVRALRLKYRAWTGTI